jgi:hypothetical protein
LTVTPYAAQLHPLRQFLTADPELGFAVAPGYAGDGIWGDASIPVHTDRSGARRDAPDRPAVENPELVAVGCEQTFGIGVAHAATYAARLGAALRWSTCNFGIPYHGGAGALLAMKRAIRLKPKVVVYGFYTTHMVRNVSPCVTEDGPIYREIPTIDVGERRVRLPSTPLLDAELADQWLLDKPSLMNKPGLMLQLKWRLIEELMATRLSLLEFIPKDAGGVTEIAAATCFVLAQMDETAAAGGTTVVVVYIPVCARSPVLPLFPGVKVATQALRHTILVDMAEPFEQELARGRPLLTPNMETLNPAAHQLIAQAVASALVQRGLATPDPPDKAKGLAAIAVLRTAMGKPTKGSSATGGMSL